MICLLVDCTNLFMMSYAVNKSATSEGVPYGGAKGVLTSLASIVRDLNPQRVICIWDGHKGNSKKRQVFSEYKKGRKQRSVGRIYEFDSSDDQEKNKEWQMTIARRIIDTFPVLQIISGDYECDDAIGYIARFAEYFNHNQTIIVSSDKDFYQLVSKNCLIYNRPTRKFITKESVIEDYGIHPNNWLLAKAIVGDNTDNLDGIKGIGFKTVTKLYDNLNLEDEISLDDFKKLTIKKEGKKYNLITENFSKIERNYKLMNLKDVFMSNSDKDILTKRIENFSPTLDRKDFYLYLMRLGERGIGIEPSLIESFMALEKY